MKNQKQLLKNAEKFWNSYPTNLLYNDHAISVQNTFKLMAEFAYEQIEKFNIEKNATLQDCDNCKPTEGYYLGTTCSKCNKSFRIVRQSK